MAGGIKIQAKINQREIRALQSTLNEIAMNTKKSIPSLILQAARFAVISAAKVTPPGGKSGKVKSLAAKWRIRPYKKIPDSQGYYYQYTDKKGVKRGFKSSTKLSVAKEKKKGRPDFQRVFKGVKAWSKKKNRFVFVPFPEEPSVKLRIRRIPFAGAAKSGWRKALRKLGKPNLAQGLGMVEQHGREITTTTVRPMLAKISNLVSYAPKVAPNSAAHGIRKANNRIRGTYLKQYSKKLSRDIRRADRAPVF